MTDRRSDSDTGDGTRTPLWVKVFGIIFVVVVLLFVILLFTRGPHRGHGAHRLPGSPSGHTSGSSHR
jgi:hypothetical protein